MAKSTLHIYRPSSTRFAAYVRRRGCRKFRALSNPRKSYLVAARQLAGAMTRSDIKEGYIMLTADYYDPSLMLRMMKP